MNREEIQQILNRILSTIASIDSRTQDMTFEQFRQNEYLKDELYSELQEIGQSADELIGYDAEKVAEIDEELRLLSNLKFATHNQETEVSHNSVWSIMKNDLLPIGERIEKSDAYKLYEAQ